MNAPTKMVTLQIGEAEVTIPAEVAAKAYLEQLLGACRAPAPEMILSPMGAAFHGGIRAGLTVHEEDPFELVLLPGEFEGPWQKAKAWAEEQGGELPSRFDLLVLWKNLKPEFKPAYYWSSETYAGDGDYAWCQGFGGGNQYASRKGDDCRARAVRRVAIR